MNWEPSWEIERPDFRAQASGLGWPTVTEPLPPSSPEKLLQWATYAGMRESEPSWWAWGCQATERSVVARLGSMRGYRMQQLEEMRNRNGPGSEWGAQRRSQEENGVNSTKGAGS